MLKKNKLTLKKVKFTYNEDQKISGQFNVIYDITNKILKSDPILFDKL